MANKNYYMEQPIDDNGIASVYNPARIKRSPHGAFIDAPIGVNVGQYFNNQTIGSQYLKDIGDVNQGRSIEDLLAEKQSGWAMAGNALVNNLAIAGTTIISGTLGLVNGILESIAQGDSTKLWDNSVTNLMEQAQEYTREALPIYRGQEYDNASIWEKMGTGIFWADLLENLGYTEGMLVPGLAASKAFQFLGKGASMLGGAVMGAVGEGATEAIKEKNDEIRNKTELANQRYSELAEGLNEEGIRDLYTDYMQTLDDIEQDANNSGNFTFGANIALLTLTNSIEFGSLFSRGFSTGRRISGQLVREGEKYVADSSRKAIAKATGKKLVDAFSEGMEEVSQAAISNTGQYYTDYNRFNESIFNPEKRQLVGDLISAFGESYANTLQDPRTAEEFASGFIIGAIGVPQLRRASVPVTVENSIVGEVYRAYQNNKREQELANTINSRLANDKAFNAYYDGLVRHLAIQDDMNTALDDADHTAFDNANSAQLISDIMMFSDAGHLDHLKELINNSVDLSDEGINAIIDETSKEGNGPFMNNGNRLSTDEVRQLIQRKQDYINHKIDFISKSKEAIEAAYPALNEVGVNNVLFLKSQLDDHKDRHGMLLEDAYNKVRAVLKTVVTNSEAEPQKDDKTAFIKSLNQILSLTKDQFRVNLANPSFLSTIHTAIKSKESELSLDELTDLSITLGDLQKLDTGIKNLNIALASALSNPQKTNSSKNEALDKTAKKNQTKKDVSLLDNIANSDVSDIVQQFDVDALSMSEVDEAINRADAEKKGIASSKVQEAKKIISTSKRMEDIINELGEDNSLDSQEIQDAIALLQSSKLVSESEDELLNTASQAYNDINTLFDDQDPSMQNITSEEIEEILSDRLDLAKSLIEEAKAILKEQNGKLNTIPDTLEGTVIKELNVETGHDSVPQVQSANERKKAQEKKNAEEQAKNKAQATINIQFAPVRDTIKQEDLSTFDSALKEVLNHIDTLIAVNTTAKEIGNTIKGLQSYNKLKSLAPTIDGYLNTYVKYKLQPTSIKNKEVTQEPNISTPIVTEDEIRRVTTQETMSTPIPVADYSYWKPTISYLPFGRAYEKGNNTPFYKLARKLRDEGKLNYTDAQLRRIEAVGEYLDKHGAFKLVDSGALMLKGKKAIAVHFRIDNALNEKAGEIVILMTDAEGRVIGDIMSPNDATFDNQLGLRAFVEKITKDYQDAGSPSIFEAKEVSSIAKNMVGKVPYLADNQEMNTLNEVFHDGQKEVPFMIGIAANSGQNARILASAGRTKKQGQSDLERSINPPLTAKAGQPFLLMPTSSAINHYMPVPVLMESYNPNTQNTALGQAIHKVLERVATSDNSTAIKVKEALEELISVQEIHINYEGDNVKVTIKPNKADHQMSIYNGPVNAPNLVEQLELGLQGQPFQVSRKYMNDTYEGQDYNRMIGEIAKVNLPIGTTHTVSEWFTINPVNSKGEEIKAKSPRSTGSNPFSANMSEITIDRGGVTYTVDVPTWDVTNGKEILGDSANTIRAHAFGIFTNQNMEKPYNTNWGYYNPVIGKFIKKPQNKQEIVKSLNVENVSNTNSTTVQIPSLNGELTRVKGTIIKDTDIKKGDNIGYTGPELHKIINYGVVETISGEDIVITPIGGGSLILPKNRVYYKLDLSTPSESQTPLLDIVEKQFSGYFEGGGALIEHDYPKLPANLIRKLENYIMGETTTSLTEEEAREFLMKSEPNLIPKELSNTPEQLRNEAKKAGLLGTKLRELLWDTLTSEQQVIIVNKKGPKQKQWMDTLATAFIPPLNTFNESILKGTVDTFLGRKGLYRKQDGHKKVWNKEKEIAWLSKVLPAFSEKERLKVLNGLIRVANSGTPEFAYGQFKQGIIIISDKAAKGTIYHEAFHAVTNTLLTETEYKDLFDAAREKWGNLDTIALEEQLAEDFRRYVQFEETPIIGSLVKLYRTLKHLIQKLVGKEPYLNRLYYNINRGKFAKRKVDKTDITRFFKESYTTEMQSIKDKAIADGTFMKAPNGNPTNLTERQWLQVRTKNFINWFGDWMNNPANASKVVDENSEPLVVYHNGAYNIRIFKGDSFGLSYFGDSMTSATYGGSETAVFLNIKNPEIVEGNGEEIGDITERKHGTRRISPEKGKDGVIYKNVKDVGEGIYEWDYEDVNAFWVEYERQGYGMVYATKNPNQIKSATDNNGMFSTENDDIRYRRLDVYNIQQQINKLRNDYTRAKVYENSIRSTDRSVVDEAIKDTGLSHMLLSYLQNNNGKWSIARISKERLNDLIKPLQDELTKAYERELSDDEKLSRQMLEEQEAYYRRVEQYHRDKLMFDNLTQEDKDYIKDRGITIKEYNQMTQLEKEVLLHCQY